MAQDKTDALAVVMYDITAMDIAATKAKYDALQAATPAGYEEVRLALRHVIDTRVRIEKRRVELKAEALAYGRRVDATAKELTALVEDIEGPLRAKKQAVDDEKTRVKREAEEKVRLEAERVQREQRESEEAERRQQHEKEQARLAAERETLRLEREKIEAERKELEARQATERLQREAADKEAQQLRDIADREALALREAEERKIAEMKRVAQEEQRKAEEDAQKIRYAEEKRIAQERLELERQKSIEQAKREAAEQAERDRAAAEEARLAELERQARIAKLAPVAQQIRVFATELLTVPMPEHEQTRKSLTVILTATVKQIETLAVTIEQGNS